MSPVLVIGGAGFIGSALVRALLPGQPVRVLDDFSTGHRHNLDGLAGVELVVGSILDRGMVGGCLDGVEVVYHLACLGVRHSIHDPRHNLEVILKDLPPPPSRKKRRIR